MRSSLAHVAALVLVLPFSGCDCGGGTLRGGTCTTSADCPASAVCTDGRCVARRDAAAVDGALPDGGLPTDAGPSCLHDTDCTGGGVCTGGTCCDRASACNGSCCAAAAVCFAGACVVPGGPCRTTADCSTGEYCEPGLGDSPDGGVGDGGTGSDAGRVCLGSAPRPGRCVALPPTCADDAGTPPPGATFCISDCEYHPTAGPLDAIPQWTWGPTADEFPTKTDVWATPAVGRIYDTNCDGTVDALDPPNVVFVSNDVMLTQCAASNTCKSGVLRVLDGATGHELLSLAHASAGSAGFAGTSVALGDMNGDHVTDIVALTGEGRIVVIDGTGTTLMTSDHVVTDSTSGNFGWGGGLAIADMDGDGHPEVAYGADVFTTATGALTRVFAGTGGSGGGGGTDLTTFADVDGMPGLELVAGRTVYTASGGVLWNRGTLPDGFPAVGDLDGDGLPEVVMVGSGTLYGLDGLTGATKFGPYTIGGSGNGGPPTIADFDGDGHPEIGVAQANFYSVLKPMAGTGGAAGTFTLVWHHQNHDLSSSQTGSTVFDFEGDGTSEVVYNDECFLWVFSGPTGTVRFAGYTSSFTGTEASMVADIDGDGHAEMVEISNGVNMHNWNCDALIPGPMGDLPRWSPPSYGMAYRGLTAWKDRADSWVGTRPLWNEHTYHVTNVCDENDDACSPRMPHGTIPTHETSNWTLPWLNNFRQNVQQAGLFDAPDATVTLTIDCETPPVLHGLVRNLGSAILPAGVTVGFYAERTPEAMLGMGTTTMPLFPGEVEDVVFTAPTGYDTTDTYVARILVDPTMPLFRECRADNDESPPTVAHCLM